MNYIAMHIHQNGNNMKTIIKHLFLIFTYALILISCGEKKSENTIIIGTSADNPPYEFLRNGQIIGLDIDLINEIARELKRTSK